jgi:Putative DNA-binding domain
MTLPSNLLTTTQVDIDRLLSNCVREGPHLDFKRALPVAWDSSAKHELLADVTAFANAGGGDLIFGVDENQDAEASAIVPQVVGSVDTESLRLQDFLLSLAEPRLPGVEVHAVPVAVGLTSGYVLVIRVPQSWNGPHRVKTNQHFYVRDGLRKRQLDIPEVRALFLRSESQTQRIKDFRADRLGKILIGETPCQLQAGPQLIVHAIPTQAVLGLVQLDPVPYARRAVTMPMMGRDSASTVSLNLDGAYGVLRSRQTGISVYTQVFRQGFFEAVWVLSPFENDTQPMLPGIAYERYVNQFLEQVRGDLSRQGLALDLSVFISLLEADQVVFAGPSDLGVGGYVPRRFDRKTVILPDVLIPADVSIGRGMRPAYDLMCQAVGLDGSVNYAADGEWSGGSR